MCDVCNTQDDDLIGSIPLEEDLKIRVVADPKSASVSTKCPSVVIGVGGGMLVVMHFAYFRSRHLVLVWDEM